MTHNAADRHPSNKASAQRRFIVMSTRQYVIALILALFVVLPLEAQQLDSGTVIVTVRETMGMVEGILVRSESRVATTDGTGRTRLVLPAGRRTLFVTRIGFVPKRTDIVVIADSTIMVTIDIAMAGMVAAI